LLLPNANIVSKLFFIGLTVIVVELYDRDQSKEEKGIYVK